MLPLKDYNPVTRPAIVVPILIAINVGVFFFVQPTLRHAAGQRADEAQIEFFVCKAAIPQEVMHGKRLADTPAATLDQEGRVFGEFEGQRCPHKSVWLSILSSMFFHGGFLHIAGNMLFLFIFGNNVEDRLGRGRFAVFYFLCGLAATFAQSVVSPSSVVPMIGASGAIAGVLGAYILMFPRARVRTLIFFFFITVIDIPAVVLLGLWFVMQVFQGVGSVAGRAGGGVAYMAHVGGFVAGMALLKLFRPARPESPAPYYP